MVLKTVSSVSGGGGGGGNGTVTQVNTGTGLTGGPITTSGTVSIANTGVTQGVYGGGSNIAVITITPQGQINVASNQTITVPNTSVVAGTYGNSTAVGTFTVLSDGRVNAASNVLIANIVLGNAQLQVGQTTATVGNLTLNAPVINNPTGNVVPAIPAGSIPNNLLANSVTTLGNATLTLGGTTTVVGNLTLNNATIVAAANIADSAGPVRDIPQNLQGTTYTLVLADDGKHIYSNSNVTVPNSVFSTGNVISIVNKSNTASITILRAGSVNMYLAGNVTSADRSLSTYGVCTLLCVSANTFIIGGSGVT